MSNKKINVELQKLVGTKFDFETVTEIIEEVGHVKGKSIMITKNPTSSFQYSASIGEVIFLFKADESKIITGVYS